MHLLLILALTWTLLSVPVGLMIGRAMRIADRRDAEATRPSSLVPDFIPDEVLASVAAGRRDAA
ncbi:hypothetical protein GCM10010531_38860 [Blastococcus jejuensis]|uniref:Uncharacterized protein n=1 Tax=Blastococcus jejuensis TaxID=351224 RepID=A0ABP6PJS0_9ACTN